jgi:hypothetical protein
MLSIHFHSSQNVDSIKESIQDAIRKELNIKSNFIEKYNDGLKETMKYVESKVSKEIPPGLSEDEYIYMMNKKVQNIVLPLIKENLLKDPKVIEEEKKVKKVIKKKEKKEVVEKKDKSNTGGLPSYLFDLQLDETNYENFQTEKDEKEVGTIYVEDIAPEDMLQNKNTEVYQMMDPTDPKKLYENIFQQAEVPKRDHNILINNQDRINNTNNNNDLNFSPYGNDRLTTVILPPKTDMIEKNVKVIVNSFYRNKELYPDQNYFEIKFSPASNSYILDSYVDSEGVLIYQGKEIVLGDPQGTTVSIGFDNIKQVKISDILCPVIANYRGGRGPVLYNGPKEITNQSNFSQYDAIFTKSVGIPQGIFKEPLLYLIIPQLQGNIFGTGDFIRKAYSRLVPEYGSNPGFVSVYTSLYSALRPMDDTEFYVYDPVSGGRIDKITPSIFNYHGQFYDFGIDKLYIDLLYPGTKRYNGYCGPKYRYTKILIQRENDGYIPYCSNTSVYKQACNTLNSHPIAPGDLIYFFDTRPQEQDVIYFEEYIKIYKIEGFGRTPGPPGPASLREKLASLEEVEDDNDDDNDEEFLDIPLDGSTNYQNYNVNDYLNVNPDEYSNVSYQLGPTGINEIQYSKEEAGRDRKGPTGRTGGTGGRTGGTGSKPKPKPLGPVKYLRIYAGYFKEIVEKNMRANGIKFKEADCSPLDSSQKLYTIDFKDFIPGGSSNSPNIYQQYYIAMGIKQPDSAGISTYYFPIFGFEGNAIIVKNRKSYDREITGVLTKIVKFGFVKGNQQGISSDDPRSLFYRNGFHVYKVGNFSKAAQENSENVNQFIIEIDYPWEYIDPYFSYLSNVYTYSPGESYLIQHKLQLLYTFEITSKIKDSSIIQSDFQGTGLNF